MIPDDHPLQKLFLELVARHYAEAIGIRDQELVGYVAHLLTEYCDTEQLFKIHDAMGKPLTDVGGMLLESNPVYGPAPSFDRERQVRKHIGDYTLFFTGMYPESINHLRLRRNRLENFVDNFRSPRRGRYALQPAKTNEDGIVDLPPAPFDPVPFATAAALFCAGVALGAGYLDDNKRR